MADDKTNVEKETLTPEEAFGRICAEFEALFVHVKEFATAFGPKGPHMMDAGNLLFFLETAFLWLNKLRLMTIDQEKLAATLQEAGKLKVVAGGADVGKQV